MLTQLFYVTFGGASAFVESTLAQIYKKRNADGTSYGGPAFYIFATILVFVGVMASAGRKKKAETFQRFSPCRSILM